MARFNEILTGTPEELIKIFYLYDGDTQEDSELKRKTIAKIIKLKSEQLTCAIGFNPNIEELTDILPILGYENIDELTKDRNDIFINDTYRKLPLENILAIYETVKDKQKMLQVMQYLLEGRLASIESKIEETVNSLIIEKYKAEMRAIYSDNIADIDFAEKRLSKTDSGFRALLNEVTIIAESKLLPAGDIFFRETILPEEKRKLLNKGMIPLNLIETRLKEKQISQQEKKMLLDYIKLSKKNDNTGTDS